MPTVSVCIPTLNYARFLPDALASVLAQTYTDFELIVIDNASTDATPEIMGKFAEAYPGVRYYRNPVTLNLAENLNHALALATGDYVKILCADDMLEPGALERAVALLERHPDVSLVATGRVIVDSDLRPLGYASYSSKDRIVTGFDVVDRCLFGANYIGEPSAVLFRRRQAERGFDLTYTLLVDLEMWFHLLEQGNLASVARASVQIRQHGGQFTETYRRSGQLVMDRKRLLRDYKDRAYVRMTTWKTLRWRLRTAYGAWRSGPEHGTALAISEFVPVVYFYLLLPALTVARYLALALRRWRLPR